MTVTSRIVMVCLLTGGILASRPVAAADLNRTLFSVDRLSCTSCLSAIEAKLQTMPGVRGMYGSLRQRLVAVDHRDGVEESDIAAAITGLGYPASILGTSVISDRRPLPQARRAAGGGCGSGCSRPAQGPSVWARPAAGSDMITRTTFRVDNLSCTSCLATIQDRLRTLAGTLGMRGYLRQGLVVVDHEGTTAGGIIAKAISAAGYPARAVGSTPVPADRLPVPRPADGKAAVQRQGWNCTGSSAPCNATAASWKNLFNRYFSEKK